MLDDPTRRRLQRLRFLLEDALRLTQEQPEPGRHTALVLLDGACEYAMGLSLGALGVPSERAHFRGKFDRLRQERPQWQPPNWTGIEQLHAARNQAQHQGTLPDPAEMPGWAADAERFVDSLVTEVFATDLKDVLIADSVETAEVRDPLVEAEKGLAGGDATAAFAATLRAFDAARSTWRGQRGEAIGRMTLYAASQFPIHDLARDPVNSALLRFEDIAEVQPFAPDIAEYFWLGVRREEQQDAIGISDDDAKRAFSFVIGWVLRWEAFTARYRGRRYPPPPPAYEPPRTGAATPQIWSARVEQPVHVGDIFAGASLENVRFHVLVALSDIPVADTEAWAQETAAALEAIIARSGNGRVSGGTVDVDGLVRIFSVTAELGGTEIYEWINEAIAEGADRLRGRVDRERHVQARLSGVGDRFADSLQEVRCRDSAFVGAVTAERDGDVIKVGAHLNAPMDPIFGQLLDNVVTELRAGKGGVDYHSRAIWFEETVPVETARELIQQVADEYGARSQARERGLVEVAEHAHRLGAEITEHSRATPEAGAGSASGSAAER